MDKTAVATIVMGKKERIYTLVFHKEPLLEIV